MAPETRQDYEIEHCDTSMRGGKDKSNAGVELTSDAYELYIARTRTVMSSGGDRGGSKSGTR